MTPYDKKTYNVKTNKPRLEQEAPENAATRKRLDDYLSRTGLTLQEFARRLGYGHSTMVHFMGDRYQYVAGSAHNLRMQSTSSSNSIRSHRRRRSPAISTRPRTFA
jgi:hypothetical protein